MRKADLRKHFAKLGVSPVEAALYLESLKGGPATVQELSRAIGENRVTAHSALERLTEKGLVFETWKGKRRLIAAEEPDILRRLVERRREEFNELERHHETLVGFLNSVQRLETGRPSVKFLEGVEGLKRMLESTLEARGEVLVFTFVEMFARILKPEYLEGYFQRRAERGIHTRLIFPPCDFADRVGPKSTRVSDSNPVDAQGRLMEFGDLFVERHRGHYVA